MTNYSSLVENFSAGKPRNRLNLPIQLLNNDRHHYQRDRSESRIQELLANLDHRPPALVAKRRDGTYWIINGQHHIEAHQRAGATHYPCYVVTSTGWEDEKEIFDRFQKHQAVQEQERQVSQS